MVDKAIETKREREVTRLLKLIEKNSGTTFEPVIRSKFDAWVVDEVIKRGLVQVESPRMSLTRAGRDSLRPPRLGEITGKNTRHYSRKGRAGGRKSKAGRK